MIALVYLVFDVEVALTYPWAVVYGDAAAVAARVGQTLFQVRAAALVDLLSSSACCWSASPTCGGSATSTGSARPPPPRLTGRPIGYSFDPAAGHGGSPFSAVAQW